MRAEELHEQSKTIGAHRDRLFAVELEKVFHHINRVHAQCSKMYTFYSVPLIVPGEPFYHHADCLAYIKKQLRDNGYRIRLHKDGRTLFIAWDHPPAPPVSATPAPEAPMTSVKRPAPAEEEELVIMFNPADPLSQLNLRAQLMAANPKYDHITKQGSRR